ncbi:DUF308 domain-containing protein [Paenibacillus xerothermodurans]|uniref:DUF308 domain-containing protein n=1 Tax=Paenibacillus xerothermodurans TaxID=1977292 RepID=A0A2W1NG66_PAEXE|nr:DUF308 domain-containing protein [Paenibacillus xerothermodurans]PZE22680.1 DUF308 domain-containing protein [Paenibacillus xerothermodurans]
MSDQEQRPQGTAPGQTGRLSLEQHPETGRNHQEEYAAEVTPTVPANAPVDVRDVTNRTRQAESNAADLPRGRGLAYTALVLAILSLFVFPMLFGAVALVLGIISYFQGNRALGAWSVILSLISIGGYFLLVPLYA